MEKGVTIGITRGRDPQKTENYRRWLTSSDVDVRVVDLNSVAEPVDEVVPMLDGVVLTGGSDVNPERYGREDASDVCTGIDIDRDALETTVFELATTNSVPILGICRGLQMINVLRGGTLIPHLPDSIPGSESHQKNAGVDSEHDVTVIPGSMLYKAVGELGGTVNSAHHQAIDRVAEGLTVSARSEDGVIEAVEPIDPNGRGYLLAVQWHPERMRDLQSPFSRNLLTAFLFEAESRSTLAL